MTTQPIGILATSPQALDAAAQEKRVAAIAAELDIPGMRAYRETLAAHDWAFEWSDNASVAYVGRGQLQYLRAVQPELDPDGAIWNSFAPKGYRINEAKAPGREEVLVALKQLIDAAADSLDQSTFLQSARAKAYDVWALARETKQL